MATHWLQKERWLNGSASHPLIEIWDGTRFAEVSWFWDPSKRWLLPVRCGLCHKIISTEEITSAMEGVEVLTPELTIVCPHCYTKFSHSPQYMNGDPRN